MNVELSFKEVDFILKILNRELIELKETLANDLNNKAIKEDYASLKKLIAKLRVGK